MRGSNPGDKCVMCGEKKISNSCGAEIQELIAEAFTPGAVPVFNAWFLCINCFHRFTEMEGQCSLCNADTPLSHDVYTVSKNSSPWTEITLCKECGSKIVNLLAHSDAEKQVLNTPDFGVF
jgi:5-methylcytosine-specific restriction endonuclease McrA